MIDFNKVNTTMIKLGKMVKNNNDNKDKILLTEINLSITKINTMMMYHYKMPNFKMIN